MLLYGQGTLLQATLNGALSKSDHPAVPVTVEELAEDAVSCVAARAKSFHLHPRDEAGKERLDAATVDRVVAAVRGRHGQPVGVSTGAWIEPEAGRRVALVSRWTQPDFATVNLSEDGSLGVMRALLQAGSASKLACGQSPTLSFWRAAGWPTACCEFASNRSRSAAPMRLTWSARSTPCSIEAM